MPLETDQFFKKTLIDKADATTTYIGKASPASSSADNVWSIKRITNLGGGDYAIEWADGVAAFSKKWNDRATYTYS